MPATAQGEAAVRAVGGLVDDLVDEELVFAHGEFIGAHDVGKDQVGHLGRHTGRVDLLLLDLLGDLLLVVGEELVDLAVLGRVVLLLEPIERLLDAGAQVGAVDVQVIRS